MEAIDSLVGSSLGPYTILRLIGRGGMGVVYEARHRSLGKRVALKLLHPHYSDRRDALKRFEREARAAAQLRHPHVVNVFDIGHEAGCAFLAMDLVEGDTLAQRLAEGGPLSLREIADVVLPVASAV